MQLSRFSAGSIHQRFITLWFHHDYLWSWSWRQALKASSWYKVSIDSWSHRQSFEMATKQCTSFLQFVGKQLSWNEGSIQEQKTDKTCRKPSNQPEFREQIRNDLTHPTAQAQAFMGQHHQRHLKIRIIWLKWFKLERRLWRHWRRHQDGGFDSHFNQSPKLHGRCTFFDISCAFNTTGGNNNDSVLHETATRLQTCILWRVHCWFLTWFWASSAATFFFTADRRAIQQLSQSVSFDIFHLHLWVTFLFFLFRNLAHQIVLISNLITLRISSALSRRRLFSRTTTATSQISRNFTDLGMTEKHYFLFSGRDLFLM